MKFSYDVIVVGAGHAGCEAACAAATMGSETLLITMDMNKIAQMSCNPAVGGIAKGQIVREIDALGGRMGIVTDATSIQFRMLNRSKGPAMWSPRSQCDRQKFITTWRHQIETTDHLYVWQDTVDRLLIDKDEVHGVHTLLDVEFHARSVILTNGTFLSGLMHFGRTQLPGGRVAEPASYGITQQLAELGFTTNRMKTGTPVRIDIRSVDLSLMEEQQGDTDFHKFSYLTHSRTQLRQLPCYTTATNAEVHRILRSGLKDSPLFNGQIKSIGPRYCPSIETKIVTFADKDSHPLFLEPEGETTGEYYLNGFSSSLPLQIQLEALQQIPAFRNLHIHRPGYAIEYDFFDPRQLKHSLETKRIKRLFFAGQINGTTGYEEAAGQGLAAGINAHLACHEMPAFTMERDQSYIGVLIDDLVTKGVDEPYRMFTSRAEHRILLRQDDADRRLTERSYQLGLATEQRHTLWKRKEQAIDALTELLRQHRIAPDEINHFLEQKHSAVLRQGTKASELLLRPDITLPELIEQLPSLHEATDFVKERREEILEATEIILKYAGYIHREQLIAEKIQRLEDIRIKGHFDYNSINAISTEARQKLAKIDPETIAQASRIPGISPSDINVLLVMMGR